MTEHIRRRCIEFGHLIVMSLFFPLRGGSFIQPGQGLVIDLVIFSDGLLISGLDLPFWYRLLLLYHGCWKWRRRFIHKVPH